MKLKKIISIYLLFFTVVTYSQDITTDVVNKEGVKSNVTSVSTGMYNSSESATALKFFELASEYAKKEDFKNAEKYYLKALKEDEKFVEAYDNLGRIYRRIGEYDKAITFYKKSIELYPEGIMAHQNIAVVYGIIKDYENAIIEYIEIIKLSPDNAEGYFGLANTYMITSRFELAIEYSKKTIDIYKRTDSHYLGDGYYLTGLIYYYSRDNENAKTYLLLAKDNGVKIDARIEKELFTDAPQNQDIQLNTKEDYKKYESKVLEDIDWVLNKPLSQNLDDRKEKYSFLVKWMTGSPNVSIEFNEKIITYMDCSDCLIIFMSSWTKYALTANDFNKFDATFNATESVMNFYTANSELIGRNKAIEKYIKLKKKGELKAYLKANL